MDKSNDKIRRCIKCANITEYTLRTKVSAKPCCYYCKEVLVRALNLLGISWSYRVGGGV